ncbi:two-component response regulator colocalized with HrtAB transporter [Jeotgalibacillus alimentarius]|uniref:Heme response regulator HssR n=1 Tax=Jeotgalibacillus alimentarius TaxID=135826 RepID=A0A0C2QXK8_9BACL|nr:response regulator transcription factor [Jeotgalibacillus alimentarius]KIL42795.1 two-component response regulator colocalized with HrtAB transporter [Jeotgalibacillus alimentarius]
MIHILAVDDDARMLDFTGRELREAGYQTILASSGDEALRRLEAERVDLAVVDVMMPGIDGFELTKMIREMYGIPVILLTARHHIEDKERGFSAGSDDYIVKPFEAKELLFRVKAVLRRVHGSDETLTAGDLVIDRRSYEIRIGGKKLIIPLKEFELLTLLAAHPGQAFSRDQIIERVWGFDYEGDEQTVNVHIKRLRSRLQHSEVEIVTVRGIGYKLEVMQ